MATSLEDSTIPPAPPLDLNVLQEFAERIRIRSASQRFAPEFVQAAGDSFDAAGTPPAASPSDATVFDENTLTFGEPDSLNNIQLNEDGVTVKAATLTKLIEKISSTTTDVKMIFDFLLTYRTYATPMQLLSLLRERFRCPAPSGMTGSSLIQFTTEQTIVRLKVVNIVKHWIERNWWDWISEESMADAFAQFIDTWDRHPYTARMADQVRKSLEKRRQHHGSADDSLDTPNMTDSSRQRVFNCKPPPAEWPVEKRADKLTVFNVNSAEVARQLTLIEWDLWEAIKPWEFLNQAWTKKAKESLAPGICRLIKHFNFIAAWVSTSIVAVEPLRDRARMIERFIDIAVACKDIGNFNAVMEILSGLGNAGVFRLKLTWEEVNQRSKVSYQQLKQIMAPERNFTAFREQLKSINPPTIPYIGIFLTDLIFINDGSKDFITTTSAQNESVQLINFSKCRMVAAHIQLVMQYQQSAYNFHLVPVVEEYILHHTYAWDEDFIYKMSQFVEPRPGSEKPPRPDSGSCKPLHAVLFQTDPREFSSETLVIQHSLLQAATLKKLVRHVVFVDRYEGLAAEMFSTYRAFTSASKLLRRFASVAKAAPEESSEVSIDPGSRLYKIRLKPFVVSRISALLSVWFVQHASEIFQEQSSEAIVEWLNSVWNAFDSIRVPSLIKQLEVHVKRASVGASRPNIPPPKPILPTSTVTSILDIHALEVSRQLALHGFELIRRVASKDIFEYLKSDGDGIKVVSPTIRRLFEHRDRLNGWIRAEIAQKSPKKKLAVFEYLIEVMNSSLAHYDFMLVQDLFLNLVSTPFADVWPIISSKSTSEFQKFKDLFNGARDKEALRFRLSAIPSNTAALPPLGWFFDELNAVRKMPDIYRNDQQQSNGETMDAKRGRLAYNLSKFRRLAEFLKVMKSFETPFNYVPNPVVLDHISHLSMTTTSQDGPAAVSRQARSATVGYGPPPAASILGAVGTIDYDDLSSIKMGRLLSVPKLTDATPSKSKLRAASADSNQTPKPTSSSSSSPDRQKRREKTSHKRTRSRDDAMDDV